MAPDTNIHPTETKENGHVKRKWKGIIEIIVMWSLANAAFYSGIYDDTFILMHYVFFLFMSVYSHRESFPGSSFGVAAYCWMSLKTVCLRLVFTKTWYNWHYTLMALTFIELLQLTIYDGIRTNKNTREIHVDYQFEKASLPRTRTIQNTHTATASCGIIGNFLKRDAIQIKFVFIFLVLLYIFAPYKLYFLLANIPCIIFVTMIFFSNFVLFIEKPCIDFILYCTVMLKFAFYLRYILTLQLELYYVLVFISIIEYFQMHVSHRVQEWMCDRKIAKCRQCSGKNVWVHLSPNKGRIQSDLSFIEEIFFFCLIVVLTLYFELSIRFVITIRDIFICSIPLLVITYSVRFMVANRGLLSLNNTHVVCVNLFKFVLFIYLLNWHLLHKSLILLAVIELCQIRVLGYHIAERKVVSAPSLCECGRLDKCMICLVWSFMPYTFSLDVWRVMSYVTSCITSYMTFVDVSRLRPCIYIFDFRYKLKVYRYSRSQVQNDQEIV